MPMCRAKGEQQFGIIIMGHLKKSPTASMIWVTSNASNRRKFLGLFSDEALLPSPVMDGWTYKPKPEIERGDLPFTLPEDSRLDYLEFISPELLPANTIPK